MLKKCKIQCFFNHVFVPKMSTCIFDLFNFCFNFIIQRATFSRASICNFFACFFENIVLRGGFSPVVGNHSPFTILSVCFRQNHLRKGCQFVLRYLIGTLIHTLKAPIQAVELLSEIENGAAADFYKTIKRAKRDRRTLTRGFLKRKVYPNFLKVVQMSHLSCDSNAQHERVFSKMNWTAKGRRSNLKAENVLLVNEQAPKATTG